MYEQPESILKALSAKGHFFNEVGQTTVARQEKNEDTMGRDEGER